MASAGADVRVRDRARRGTTLAEGLGHDNTGIAGMRVRRWLREFLEGLP
ncbi:hypothetical protein ASZ90_002581 [hydrocarbon metagenome]|uniref:Uncharacterized protein n=1 Tax=hydrocarbon metagenome TaxID=938273 RepID=A0A0W8G3G7_9ZZZZ